ncbi:hypothetical protein ACPV4X_12750 [Vibrio owensii]|uniref:hypothetical protein n=1 Tax=Vibrio owensii TaxID=696485 RepID=UPI004068140A
MFSRMLSSNNLWFDIDEVFGDQGGIYLLSCVDDSDKPIPIHRLLGIDNKGVLYIGKADSFKDRVIELKKSASPTYKTASHECGVRLSNSRLSERFPFSKLVVTLISSPNGRVLESEYLDNYIEEFGELPPMNRGT